MHKKWGLYWFWGIPVIYFMDQATKWWVLYHLFPGDTIPFLPGIQLTRLHNTGIAFSLFNQQGTVGKIILSVFIIAVCVVMSIWLAKTPRAEKETGYAFMFILGGALGNLFDRLWHGYVIDFIDGYFRTWHWYTFNIADAFITIGALILLKTILYAKRNEK